MDRGARAGIGAMNGRIAGGAPGLLLAALLVALLSVPPGCRGGGRAGLPPPAPPEPRSVDNAAPVMEWLPPAVATGGAGEEVSAPAAEPTLTDNAATAAREAEVPAVPAPAAAVAPAPGPAAAAESVAPPPAVDVARTATPSSPPAAAGETGRAAPAHASHRAKTAPAVSPSPTLPAAEARGASIPGWAKGPEELVYRVDFIGITMGYARFRYQGKVSIAGKPAFHLNVRAWTSGVLSFIFPINETIDYYLDAETLAPIRQEFTQREKDKDDVALYNQETGRITYRYRQTGKIRKQVDTVPSVYDPVSVAYYFRWRDLGAENRPRNVYAGRKIYQISSRVLGNERIRTEHGEVDTIAVRPLIRREGKPDDKGDLKIWFSSDDRRVPVRLYAKFHKIKDWTLVGELMPPAAKAGG